MAMSGASTWSPGWRRRGLGREHHAVRASMVLKLITERAFVFWLPGVQPRAMILTTA